MEENIKNKKNNNHMEDVIPIVDIKTINIKNNKKLKNNSKEKQSESEILSYSLDEDDEKKTSKKQKIK